MYLLFFSHHNRKKDKVSRLKQHTIVVDYGDLADGHFADDHVLLGAAVGVIEQFDVEELVRFPHVIVHDLYEDVLHRLLGLEHHELPDWFVVFARLRCAINRFNAE